MVAGRVKAELASCRELISNVSDLAYELHGDILTDDPLPPEPSDDPTGFMRPCESCGGEGSIEYTVYGGPFAGLRHRTCPECGGTGIHTGDES